MTGEISLQGLVLPIGGVKDKCIAASRNGITTVILPFQNKKDSLDIPEDIKKKLKLHFVKHVEENIQLALENEVD